MTGNKKFTLDYFVKKFSEIDADMIGLSTDQIPTDVWEWCSDLEEAEALYQLARPFGVLLMVNDGEFEYAGFGDTPKARVLKFLDMIRPYVEGESATEVTA